MSKNARAAVMWFYLAVTLLTFLGVTGITIFELYVRWSLNQNFSVLGSNGFLGLAILLAAQMLGLIWFSRSA